MRMPGRAYRMRTTTTTSGPAYPVTLHPRRRSRTAHAGPGVPCGALQVLRAVHCRALIDLRFGMRTRALLNPGAMRCIRLGNQARFVVYRGFMMYSRSMVYRRLMVYRRFMMNGRFMMHNRMMVAHRRTMRYMRYLPPGIMPRRTMFGASHAVHMAWVMPMTAIPRSGAPVRHKTRCRNSCYGENGSTRRCIAIHRLTIIITVNREAVHIILRITPRYGCAPPMPSYPN